MEWREVSDSNIDFRLDYNANFGTGDRITDPIVDLKRTPAIHKSQKTLKNDEFEMLFGPFTELIYISNDCCY